MTNTNRSNPKLKKQLWIMGIVVVGMFAFCFALVPLYNVFCQVTGLNGKTSSMSAGDGFGNLTTKYQVDDSHFVRMSLMTQINENTPAEFTAITKEVSLHPGEVVHTRFLVKNLTDKPIVVQAIPSVIPGIAAQHIKKIECFCFRKQPLEPHETKEMNMIFTLDPALPHKVEEINLSYTLFDIT